MKLLCKIKVERQGEITFLDSGVYSRILIIRVAPIWETFSDFKSGLRIFVVLPKDPKNALKSIVG